MNFEKKEMQKSKKEREKIIKKERKEVRKRGIGKVNKEDERKRGN